MKVSDKVIIVTGAGSGMGRELTLQLAARGAKVAAVDMRETTLLETKSLAHGRVETFVLDITDGKAVTDFPRTVETSLGPIDGLINNAGIIQPFVPVNDLSLADATKVMNVNFYGPLSMIKAVLPGLLTRPEAHILNVSSMGAYAPVPGQSVYGASKAAIKLLTEGLRSELLSTKVGVTIVFPGAINTNIAANSGMKVPATTADAPKIAMTEAADAARLMIEAIEKNKARLCIGRDAKMMDILTRLNPVYAAKVIYKQMAILLK
ncbi:MAG: hypothetical protein RL130_311 [Actinomycetota bacterium]